MNIISRSDWGARPPKSRIHTTWSKRTEFIVHHTTGATLGADQSDDWVRNIQRNHMDVNGWADIGYNFLVDSYGQVFEGRGWLIVGSHCPNHNTVGIGVAYLGDGRNPVSMEAKRAIKAVYMEAQRLKNGPLRAHVHQDFRSTACPGGELISWVRGGMSVDGGSTPPQPEPQPQPQPQPQPDDWTEAMIVALPTLKEGSRGQHVRNLQGLLVANGRPTGVDGVFGPGTKSKLQDWQRAANVAGGADGICGKNSWRGLIGA